MQNSYVVFTPVIRTVTVETCTATSVGWTFTIPAAEEPKFDDFKVSAKLVNDESSINSGS